MFGTLKNLLRRCLGFETPTHQVFGCLGHDSFAGSLKMSYISAICWRLGARATVMTPPQGRSELELISSIKCWTCGRKSPVKPIYNWGSFPKTNSSPVQLGLLPHKGSPIISLFPPIFRGKLAMSFEQNVTREVLEVFITFKLEKKRHTADTLVQWFVSSHLSKTKL